jgi:hypothetical protein
MVSQFINRLANWLSGHWLVVMLPVVVGLAAGPVVRGADFDWQVYDEQVRQAVGRHAALQFEVPAGGRRTVFTNQIVPVELAAVGDRLEITVRFRVSGGFSAASAGVRPLAIGMFDDRMTRDGPGFTDDAGYFIWINGRETRSGLVELRKRTGMGTSPSLLNPPSDSRQNLATSTVVQQAGVLEDGQSYAITLRWIRTATGVAFGSSAGSAGTAGVWLRDAATDGAVLSQTSYSVGDAQDPVTVLNQFGFYYFNNTAQPVIVELQAVEGLTPKRAPGIVTGPADLTLNRGGSGVLAVTADGTPPLAYRWFHQEDEVPNSGQASLQLTDVAAADAGLYTVEVSNAYGEAWASATVTITEEAVAPVLLGQTEPLTVLVGEPLRLEVIANGTSPLHYAWYRGTQLLIADGQSVFALSAVGLADAGDYWVEVSNEAGRVESMPIQVTVWQPPLIVEQPLSRVVEPGERLELTVAVAGVPVPVIQWRRDGQLVAGASGERLVVEAVTSAAAGRYTADVSSAAGQARSAVAVVQVLGALQVESTLPGMGALAVTTDAPIHLAFDRPVTAGFGGRALLYTEAGVLVDSIDLMRDRHTRQVGGLTYQYFPVLTDGNHATLVLQTGTLQPATAYRLVVEPGFVVDDARAAFRGLDWDHAIRFTTRDTMPDTNRLLWLVDAAGGGDFATIQGAIDAVPSGNAMPRTLLIRNGVYRELIRIPATKSWIRLHGESAAGVRIEYVNNANLNPSNQRALFWNSADHLTISKVTIHNRTAKGGSQAEAFNNNGRFVTARDARFVSFQDTLKLDAACYFVDCDIEGDVDFLWGTGPAYFEANRLHANNRGYYVQTRNLPTAHGFVFVECTLSGEPHAAGTYLARIEPSRFPGSEVVWIECAMGDHILPVGWRLDDAGDTSQLRFTSTAAPTWLAIRCGLASGWRQRGA